MTRKTKIIGIGCLCVVLAVYVGSYLVLSRIAYAKAAKEPGFDEKISGFWYIEPTGPSTENWYRWHCLCKRVYAPLNAFDCWIGTGIPPWTGGTWRGVKKNSQN
jgi:hypothetical protein